MKEETKQKIQDQIKSIDREEVNRQYRQRWEEIDLEFDPDDFWYEVPEEIDISEASVQEIVRYEKNRLMNLAYKTEFYYSYKEGWERARYCDCEADNFKECKCEGRGNRVKYVKRKREELFNINERLFTLDAIGWKASDIPGAQKLGENILQGSNEYPMLRKKIAAVTGMAVQNFKEIESEEAK